MANPLARTIMNNIAKKSLNKNHSTVYQKSNSSYEKLNDNRSITLKRLDRVADEIRGSRKANDVDTKDTYKKASNSTGNTDKNNLSLKELSLLSNVIKGNVKIEENIKTSNGRNILSLDRLAKNIKENS